MTARRPPLLLLAIALGWLGCVTADPEFLPALKPLPPRMRTRIAVADIGNDTPSAGVAGITSASTRMLVQLLERSQRFDVVPPGGEAAGGVDVLRVTFKDLQDEVLQDTVVYDRAQVVGIRHRAVVQLEWQLAAADGNPKGAGQIVGDQVRLLPDPLELPTPEQLESQAFWESPFGSATREALDSIVREAARLSGPPGT